MRMRCCVPVLRSYLCLCDCVLIEPQHHVDSSSPCTSAKLGMFLLLLQPPAEPGLLYDYTVADSSDCMTA